MAPKIEFMLNDEFEVAGEWWLPEKSNEKVHGVLRYSPTNIELELSGTFDSISDSEMGKLSPKFKEYPCIHGVTNELVKFTLLRANAYSIGPTSKYNVIHLIARKHTPPLPNLKLRKVSFYCQHLDSFVGRVLFTEERDGEGENLRSFAIKYHQPSKLEWRIDKSNALVDIQTGLNFRSNERDQWHKLHAKSFVTITADASQDLDWYIQKIWRFCYLLTLLTDEVVSPTGLRIYLDDDKNAGWHLYQTGKTRSKDREALPFFLFHLGQLFDSFETSLNKWFSVDETLLDSIHLMMDAMRSEDHSVQGRFLLLAHAVEVVSRAMTSSEYMEANEYEKVIEKMNNAIPQEVTSDHRQSLKSKIKYGNEFSFYKRIKTLLEMLSDNAREIVCSDPKKFSRGIVETRNYYTHFTDELRPKALPLASMYWASEKLALLMRIMLFRYLGIDEELIVDRIKSHFRLSQRIALAKEHPELNEGD